MLELKNVTPKTLEITSQLSVDIIIPVKEINNYIYESIPEILSLDYENFGIIIFPDTFDGDEYLTIRKMNKLRPKSYKQGEALLQDLGFILSCITVIPLLIHSFKGYVKKPDKAWFFHPIACWITLWEYGCGRLRGFLQVKETSRIGWSQ
ncbi:MAG TPA: hypothetical protein ACFYEH_05515 [Candidatus Brocadiaceae bacterium]